MTEEFALPAEAPALRDPAPGPCWVCGHGRLHLVKRGNLPGRMTPEAVRITDASYGCTADIYACGGCGFYQCPDLTGVLALYQEMDDEVYEETRNERGLQAEHLLKSLGKHKPGGRLLDVGAGSGILVEAALAKGYEAEGVEPSAPLCRRALERGLPVVEGVLPHARLAGPYDAVTLIDVIEHVPNPVEVLRDIARVMSRDGVCAIVTPDVGSLAARLLGWRWWHYRAAHIGYFDRRSLARCVAEAGLEIIETSRPSWYFPADYLAERALSYLPRGLRLPIPGALGRIVVPLNLFDSLLAVCRLADPAER